MTSNTIADRVEASAGPSRELDEAIIDHFGWRNDFGFPLPPNFVGVPIYTSSLDAAMSLVPEGWSFSVGDLRGYDPPMWRAHLRDHRTESLSKDGHSVVWVKGNTIHGPALALTASALRARARRDG